MGNVYLYFYIKENEDESIEVNAAKAFSIPSKNIFSDCFKEDGSKRPSLDRLIKTANKSDLVYIKSLDDLGNSFRDILSKWESLTKDKKADVAVLDEPLLDTRRGQELMNGFLSEIVAETLSFADRHDKEKNRERQMKGYRLGKENGVRFGRPPKPLPDNFNEIQRKWEEGKITGTDAAKACSMPLSSFRYRAKQLEATHK